MKKKFFIFPAFIALASCSDIALDEAGAIAQDLPQGFVVSKYIEINPDVRSAQLAMALKVENASAVAANSSINKTNDCRNFLSDENLVKHIYEDYLNCPLKGWNPDIRCDEGTNRDIFENWSNAYYNKIDTVRSKDGETFYNCKVNGCWAGGWEEPYWPFDEPYNPDLTKFECEVLLGDPELCDEMIKYSDNEGNRKPLKYILEDKAKAYNYNSVDSIPITIVLARVCNFNLLQASGTPDVQEDKARIAEFERNGFDTLLVEKHFILAGRYEGRPYKYCGSDDVLGAERDKSMAVELVGSGSTRFYDYSANLFCLKESDGKVYKIK